MFQQILLILDNCTVDYNPWQRLYISIFRIFCKFLYQTCISSWPNALLTHCYHFVLIWVLSVRPGFGACGDVGLDWAVFPAGKETEEVALILVRHIERAPHNLVGEALVGAVLADLLTLNQLRVALGDQLEVDQRANRRHSLAEGGEELLGELVHSLEVDGDLHRRGGALGHGCATRLVVGAADGLQQGSAHLVAVHRH